jgi:glycosyltransferase involved in cell wall biosynthesis
MEQSRSVLFLTYGFSTGGAEMMLVNLLNHLSALGGQLLVVSLSMRQNLESKLAPGINVQHFPRRWKFDFRPARQIADVIEKDSVKTVFALGMFSFFYLSLSYRLLRSKPKTIISLHSTKPRNTKEYLLNQFYARMLSGAEQLVTVCKAQADYWARVYRINKGQFKTVYNGVDTSYFTLRPDEFDKSEFRRSLGVPSDAPVIVQVAAFRKEKKHEDAVRALNILNEGSSRKAYLLFVGGGDATIREKVERVVRCLRLTSYVIFCGEQRDVRPYLWAADLFTLTSAMIETFSVAALEAMACGLPCVLTNISGAREMVFDGFNGYLVPPSDPMSLAAGWTKVMRDHSKFSPIRIRSFIEEKFTVDKCVSAYQQLIESKFAYKRSI